MACFWNYQTGDRRGRPVILLNVDCKIATKAIARRIEPLLPNLVHTDQTGFIKVQLTPKSFFRLTYSPYWPDHLCEKIVVVGFFNFFS